MVLPTLPTMFKDDQNDANAEDEDEKDRTEKEFKLNCISSILIGNVAHARIILELFVIGRVFD